MFKNLLLICITFISSSAFSFQQIQKDDSSCCICMKYDTLGIQDVIKFKSLIKEIEPYYVQHLISLSENVDLIQFEKYNYLLRLDKFLKYELSKKITSLENLNDSVSKKTKLELEYLNKNLRQKINILNGKIDACNEKEEIKMYIKKKLIVTSVEPDYYTNFVNLINSTIDKNKLNYKELIGNEVKLLEKLELKKKKLEGKEKRSVQENSDLVLLGDLITEGKDRIAKFNLEKDVVKPSLEVFREEKDIVVPKEYYLKSLIVHSDTMQLVSFKKNAEQIIVANNTMYIFRNDSLIETIKNEDNSELASIFDNKKPISVDDYEGLFFSVQIGTYSNKVKVKELRVKSNLFYKKLPNGNIRYSYGMFNELEEVEKAKEILKMIGITDIAVIAYHNKERITIKQAKRLKSNALN